MATFAQIQERVENRVIDLPSRVQTEVPALINLAMKQAMQRHNFRVMRAEHEYTTTEGERVLGEIPTGFKEWRGLPLWSDDLGRTYPLAFGESAREARLAFRDEPDLDFGSPRLLVPDDPDADGKGNLLVFPYPDGLSLFEDGEYRVTILYWKYLPDLEDPGDTNWLANHGEDYLVYRATAEAFDLNWDVERASGWSRKAVAALGDLIRLDKTQASSSTETLVPHSGARGPKIPL